MKIAVIGQGGHSKVIKDMIQEKIDWEIIGYFDDKFVKESLENGFYYGPISSVLKSIHYFNDIKIIIAIGNNIVRKRIVDHLNLPKEYYLTIVHSSAIVSPNAKIGNGTVIMPKAVINADSTIGEHCIINTHAIVEHDNIIGNFIHISPNATLTGSVKVAEGVHVGAGCTIIPNIKIGEWAVIGAGATVIDDIPAYCTAVGVPAKVRKKVIGGV